MTDPEKPINGTDPEDLPKPPSVPIPRPKGLRRGIATRTDRVPAVGAGWIEVQSRRITGRVLEVTVHPDGYPPTRLTCVGWPTVHHLQLSGDPERLHSEARVAMP